MKYKQLSVEERKTIQEMLWQKQSVRVIAKALGHNPSSMSREIKRNQTEQRHYYRPGLAHAIAVTRRSSRGGRKLDGNDQLLTYVKSFKDFRGVHSA